VHLLLGWAPKDVLDWLLSDPDGPDDEGEQEENLTSAIEQAEDPRLAASSVLNAIYSRQVADCPALQT
jgi:hypothetical protein